MSKAQTDIRTTSYDANTANAAGYQGSLDDALSQVRQELDIAAPNKARVELLHFLGASRDIREMSGEMIENDLAVYLRRANLFTSPEDDSVEYGKPDENDAILVELFDQPQHSRFSLEYAMARFPNSFPKPVQS